MTASELATFLRGEEVPRIRQRYANGHYLSVDGDEVLSALTACVGLLREAEERLSDCLDCVERPSVYALEFCTTLRLVVGKKETP